MGRFEFIALVAALIAINAFAIDIMMPGLQQIGAGLGEPDANRRQLVIPAYMLGFGILQIVFGPLSDRYGRRKPLLVGLVIYCLAALSAYAVVDFNSLVVLRLIQGAGAAASAVIAGTALVRDIFVGNEMAEPSGSVFHGVDAVADLCAGPRATITGGVGLARAVFVHGVARYPCNSLGVAGFPRNAEA